MAIRAAVAADEKVSVVVQWRIASLILISHSGPLFRLSGAGSYPASGRTMQGYRMPPAANLLRQETSPYL